ncbi:hypothetical protein H4R33_003038 [Dimargaris cristalligena]|uniref:Yeast cell wall synthesis Kre9/Knh1-like N-terminal domain-containing protein n=1 Tax=Dimargaris cristalligena TaxID=215637 RepID=A0A4Q0A0K6_9FUNG|nr:hypothetical protein H4R33_003038 [Dimargaris cristalligena]RKP38802.1 hypothetical protein BJ085DRAFT_32095 [Dimargaris cristalligena]|eukprot:RKP38802.1 hypothetical protein BJ085DRAFT_32095 [Dimargaris cristalligena]
MHRLIRFAIVGLVLAGSAMALKVEILEPYSSVAWKTGSPTVIKYKLQPDEGEKQLYVNAGETFDAYLLRDKFEFVANIQTAVNLDKLSITFDVPPTLKSGSDYFIQIGNKEHQYYSGRFSLSNPNPAVPENIDPGQRAAYMGVYRSFDRGSNVSSSSLSGASASATRSHTSSATSTDDSESSAGATATGMSMVAILALTSLPLFRYL